MTDHEVSEAYWARQRGLPASPCVIIPSLSSSSEDEYVVFYPPAPPPSPEEEKEEEQEESSYYLPSAIYNALYRVWTFSPLSFLMEL